MLHTVGMPLFYIYVFLLYDFEFLKLQNKGISTVPRIEPLGKMVRKCFFFSKELNAEIFRSYRL